MPSWNEYRETAKSRGALAFELYVVESSPLKSPPEMMTVLPDHLAYQKTEKPKGFCFLRDRFLMIQESK